MARHHVRLKLWLLCFSFWAKWQCASAHYGFISLACGGTTLVKDTTGLIWLPDEPYIGSGETAGLSLGLPFSYLRYFPNASKSCYTFPKVVPGSRYLIRGSFLYANYDGKNQPPTFEVAIDSTYVFTVSFSSTDSLEVHEVIATAAKANVSYCLITTVDGLIPVISALELRPLNEAYGDVIIGPPSHLKLLTRIDSGNFAAPYRYPTDLLDRVWGTDVSSNLLHSYFQIQNATISEPSDSYKVPQEIMRTSRVPDGASQSFDYTFGVDGSYHGYYIFVYFSELEENITTSNDTTRSLSRGDRVFNISANGVTLLPSFDIFWEAAGTLTDVVKSIFVRQSANSTLTVSFDALTSSLLPPCCNAIEVYYDAPVTNGTRDADVEALMQLKDTFSISDWAGDPCLPMSSSKFTAWDGVSCTSDVYAEYLAIVIGLDLSNRNLTGSLPDVFSNLSYLQQLNLADNNLTGSIPDLSSLTHLKTLDLHANHLGGLIPESLSSLPNLSTLFLQDNNLSGPVPESLLTKTNLTFNISGNPALKYQNGKRGINKLFKIAIGVAISVAGLLLFVAFGTVLYHHSKKRKSKLSHFSVFDLDRSPGPTYVMKSPIMDPVDIELPIHVQNLSLKEVETVTSNFKSRIGEGGFGAVYYGSLPDGSSVAVKVRSLTSNQGTREFTTELNLLSEIRHENLVPLVGFCSENQQQILIYPYMSNGSLHDRLYGDPSKRKALDWQTRLNIALGAARGLNFLHSGGERCIIHRDVKTSNILLDDSMKAKVADFGLSKYAPVEGESLVSTEVRGTAGYLDPEYYSTQQLTDKSDVFSFGVVLLELICGREPLNIQRPRPEWSLLEWVMPFIRDSNIQPIVDPRMSMSYTPEALWRVLETALASVEPHSSRRPTMADVVRELEDALVIENNASQYMASIQSLDFMCLSSLDIKSPAAFPAFPLSLQFEPSPVFSETMGSPDPR